MYGSLQSNGRAREGFPRAWHTMEDAPHIAYYRRRAAELRGYAERTDNVSLRLEFLKIAVSFEELADLAAKYPAHNIAS